ncbi:MAG: hypothetical protein K5767_08650 [Clostridia bacterium]|nr:hypothetical protein [Clostridia bacterium]
MKIFLVSTGYIDIAHVLRLKCKKRLLKRVLLAARDQYTLSKFKNKIPMINYSRISPDPGTSTPLEQERSRMEKLREVFMKNFEGAGDLLMVCGCEAQEAAALPVVQDVCRELGVRFHVLFIAPFLFEGQRRAKALSEMMKSMTADYKSVSLYYPDELLRVIRRKNTDEPESPVLSGSAPSLSEALEALEEEAAILTVELSRQIPKLDRYMQYTYDFKLREFSLAVEPEKLLEKMWRSVADDDENFKDALEYSEDVGLAILREAAGMGGASGSGSTGADGLGVPGTTDVGGLDGLAPGGSTGTGSTEPGLDGLGLTGAGSESTAAGLAGLGGLTPGGSTDVGLAGLGGLTPGGSTDAGPGSTDAGARAPLRGSRDRSKLNFKLPLVGMFATGSANTASKPSAYNVVSSQSIPMGAYQQQTNSSSLDRLVDGIKVLIGAERGEVVDPAKMRKMQARLAKEINKFQVRQSKAVVKYGSDVPTTMRTMDEALASIYLSDEELALEDLEEAVEFAEEFAQLPDTRNTGSTPFQRAALAASANQDQPKSWAQIKAERAQEAGVTADAPGTGAAAGSAPVMAAGTAQGTTGAGTVPAGAEVKAASGDAGRTASGASGKAAPIQQVQVNAATQAAGQGTPIQPGKDPGTKAQTGQQVSGQQTGGVKAPGQQTSGVRAPQTGNAGAAQDQTRAAAAVQLKEKPIEPGKASGAKAQPGQQASGQQTSGVKAPGQKSSGVKAPQTGSTGAAQAGGTKAPQVGGVKAPQVGGVKAPQVGGVKAPQVGGVKAPKVGLETNKPPGLGKVAAPDMSKVRAVDAPPLDPPSRPKAPTIRPQEADRPASSGAAPDTGKQETGSGTTDNRSRRAAVAMAMLGAAKGTPEAKSSQQVYGGRVANGKLDVLDTKDVRQKPMNADDLRAARKDEVNDPVPETIVEEAAEPAERTKSTWAQRREERQREKLRKKLQKAEEKAAIAKAKAEEALKEVEIISKQDPNDL